MSIAQVLAGERSWHVECCDVLAGLRAMPGGEVQTVITSPPYWGLRNYGVDGQLGLEPSIAEYLAKMVEVFREVRRVLRPDGTLWLNLGDSYMGSGRGPQGQGGSLLQSYWSDDEHRDGLPLRGQCSDGLKPKDLCMVPFRLAIALQMDGWWVRAPIIWDKPNPMPESVYDRPTTSHEYVFLCAPSARYFYDAEAVRGPVTGTANARGNGVNPKAKVPMGWDTGPGSHRDLTGRYPRSKQNESFSGSVTELGTSRNLRTVWRIATEAYHGAHFATFPTELVRPCILAGTSERGCCPTCGAPWRRIVERQRLLDGDLPVTGKFSGPKEPRRMPANGISHMRYSTETSTTGWEPSCKCPEHEPMPCLVLDPFSGTSTVGVVAQRLGRRYIGLELNPDFVGMGRERILSDCPMFNAPVARDD